MRYGWTYWRRGLEPSTLAHGTLNATLHHGLPLPHRMPSSLDPTRRALAAFLAGGAFRPLWAAVMDAAPRVDGDPQVAERERDAFDELYDLVCAATGDPLDVDGAEVVETDAAELRAQLRELGLERLGAPPA